MDMMMMMSIVLTGSVVQLLSVRCPHSLNISETTRPIKAKFHMERQWDKGTKVCSNPGHMTMRHCPYMVKMLQKSSSRKPAG